MTSGDRAGVGCLGSVLSALAFLVGLAVFLVVLVLVAGVFMAAIVVALVALGIHRLMLALSPRYRDRRRAHGAFQPTTRVIETTARVIDSTKPKRPE